VPIGCGNKYLLLKTAVTADSADFNPTLAIQGWEVCHHIIVGIYHGMNCISDWPAMLSLAPSFNHIVSLDALALMLSYKVTEFVDSFALMLICCPE